MDGAKPVQVVFTPDEYEAVLRCADQLGLTIGEFIRRAATVRSAEPVAAGEPGCSRPGSPAVVPPVSRRLGGDGAPALRRFLDTLASAPGREAGQDSEMSGA